MARTSRRAAAAAPRGYEDQPQFRFMVLWSWVLAPVMVAAGLLAGWSLPLPEIPDALLDIPEATSPPEPPASPELPDLNEPPELPDVPELPDLPEPPELPEVPEVPELPDAPELPDFPPPPTNEVT